MFVVLLGGDGNTSQDLAWQALLTNIDYSRSVYEEGVFLYDIREKKPQPVLLELGRILFNKWLEGIRSYGVNFKKDNTFYVQAIYTTKFPSGLHQIESGDDKGTFTNSAGDIIVPGVEYLSGSNRKKQALEKIKSIEQYFDNESQEAILELIELRTFSNQLQGLNNREAIEVSIKAKKWYVVKSCLDDIFSATAGGKVVKIDFGVLLPKCMRLPSARVRRSAAMCAWQVRDKRLCDPLIALLDDKDPKVRYNAISALVKQGEKRAIAKIKQMAEKDPALPVQQWSQIAAQYIEKGLEL